MSDIFETMSTRYLILIFMVLGTGQAQKDCANQMFGHPAIGEENTKIDTENTTIIMMDEGRGQNNDPPEISDQYKPMLDCCGKVLGWGVDYQTGGGRLRPQLWRPVGGDKYLLVGQDDVTQGNGAIYNTTAQSNIFAQVGDRIGFTGNTVEWGEKVGYRGIYCGWVLKATNLDLSPGDTYTLTTKHPKVAGNTKASPMMLGFGIAVYVERRDDPECIISPSQITITESTAIGTVIARVVTSRKVDFSIPGYNYTLVSNGGLTSITIDSISGNITTTANLTVKTPGSTDFFTLEAKTTEMVCEKFATCTVPVRLEFVNHDITIPTLPKTTHLLESTIVVKHLDTIETADMNRNTGNDFTPTCIIPKTLPAAAPVTLTKNAIVQTKYDLTYDNSTRLNYDAVKVYEITVQCWDNYGSTASGTYTLSIDNNFPPNVTETGTICNTVDARKINNLDKVLYVPVYDAEGDTIESTYTARNQFSPFAWDSKNLSIYATQKLLAVEQEEFNFYVRIWDKWNRAANYFLCVKLIGINSRPEFTNCPENIQLHEDKDKGYPPFRALFVDQNFARDNQKSTYNMTVTPSVYTSTFDLDINTGQLTVSGNGQGIDFEKSEPLLNGDCIKLDISVSDGIHPAKTNCAICIYIIDVNEQPVISPTTKTITLDEEKEVPYTLPGVSFTVTDPDTADTGHHQYSIVTASNSDNYFSINTKNGTITLDKRLDLEALASSNFRLVINVEDPRGMSAESVLMINVNDLNDNTPTISPKSQEVTISSTTSTSMPLATFTADDPDSGNNGDFTLTVSGVGLGASNFRIVQAGKTGKLYLKSALSISTTMSFIITIAATDKGASPLVGYANVRVNYDYASTTPAGYGSTKPPLSLFETPEGVSIITALVLLGVVALSLVGYVAYINLFKNSFHRFMDNRMTMNRKPMGRNNWNVHPRNDEVYRTRVRYHHHRDLPPSGVYEN